jgi:DNA-binding transcriptional regulator YiaG
MNDFKAARRAAGLTQAEMSERLGIPARTIQDWEAGARRPPEWAKKLVLEKLENLQKER